MIDLSRARRDLLADVGVTDPRDASVGDPLDARWHGAEAFSLRMVGHTRDELFPGLEVLLSGRFSQLPRRRLLGDLLVPLRHGLGNAHKRGNGGDASLWIEVALAVGVGGAFVAIRNEGQGFDVEATVERYRRRQQYFTGWGGGFRAFDRAGSSVSFDDRGRTLLLAFATEGSGTPGPPPRALAGTTLESAHDQHDGLGHSELLLFGPRAGDPALRCVLRRDAAAGSTPVLSGRILATPQDVRTDWKAGWMLHGVLRTRRIRVPRPVARLPSERLALYDCAPWQDLFDYLAVLDKSTETVRMAKRLGSFLGALHGSEIPFQREAPSRMLARMLDTAKGARHLLESRPHADRFDALVKASEARIASLDAGRVAPVHGRLGFDRLHFGLDGRFYVLGFEHCRRSHPAVDLAGALVDLQIVCDAQDQQLYAAAREVLLGAYLGSDAEQAPDVPPVFTAAALLARLGRRLHGGPGHPDPEWLFRHCEAALDGAV